MEKHFPALSSRQMMPLETVGVLKLLLRTQYRCQS